MISGSISRPVCFVHVDGRLDHGAGLHLGDLRIGDGQTAAAMAQHGVELVEVGDHWP